MTDHLVSFQKVRLAVVPSVRASVRTPPGDPLLVEPLSLIDLEPGLVSGSDKLYAGAYYSTPPLLGGALTPHYDVGVRDPLDIQDELDPWLRFLPLAPYIGYDAGSPRKAILAPVGSHLASPDYPWALQLFEYRGEGDLVWSSAAPQPDYEYYYQCLGDERAIPALTFNGTTGMARFVRYSGPTSFDDLTLAMVVVPHHGSDDYYPLFEWDGAGDSYTQLRYTKGRISLVRNHRELVAHSSHAKAGEPVVVIVSLNGSDDEGTFMVCDSSRRTKAALAVSGLAYTGLSGTLGAARTRALYPRPIFGRFGDMELLDLVWWNTPMTSAMLEYRLGLLAQAWGVRT